MISSAIRLARVGSGSELAAAVLMGLGYPCLLLAALLPSLWFFAAAAAVTYVADWYLHQRGAYLINRLIKVRAGLSIRFLVRQVLLILLLARMHLSDGNLYYAAVAGFLILYGLQVPQGVLTTMIRLRRTMPVVTRNVDLHAVRIPNAPPRFLVKRPGEKMLHLDLPGLIGVLIAAQTGRYVIGYSGVSVTIAAALIYVLLLVPYLRRKRLVPRPPEMLETVDNWLREYQPTVMLYFSGSKESAYQVNMWLETMEQIAGRPLIVLRERAIAAQLGPTAVPVICVPGGTHLMNLDLSSVRVALYAANVGKNIHLLRVPTMKHVFIGHGDSDKIASVNPYSKVYDEVWTAGQAGRDRYALTDVGVRDDVIVEVGRPQLAPIEVGNGISRNPIPTVLYAPTWEGWDDNPGNTSLLLAGENIIRRLVEAPQPVRVIYKPHPFTGIRDPHAQVVHERIKAMLSAATTARAHESRWAETTAKYSAELAAASVDLARIEAELTALSTPGRPAADEAEESRVSLADRHRMEQTGRLRAEWNDAYWRSFGWWEHRVVVGAEPTLYDCFNQSDAMVSDISSVVSDFIASGKPYAVTDSGELGEEEFKRQNTAVRAAVILSNDAAELEQLLAAVADPKDDPLIGARRDLKRYLLGPDEPSSMEQFNAAIVALAAKSEARNAVVAQRLTQPEAAAAPDDSAPVDAGDEEGPEPEENEPVEPEQTGLDSPVRG